MSTVNRGLYHLLLLLVYIIRMTALNDFHPGHTLLPTLVDEELNQAL